jgi:hypothetical protein
MPDTRKCDEQGREPEAVSRDLGVPVARLSEWRD